MELQSKKKSVWTAFKKAYLKSRNLKKFWNRLEKKNLPEDFIKIFEEFINSESYNWSSKHWYNNIINHLTAISDSKYESYSSLISQEYFYFDHFNDSMINGLCKKIADRKINLSVNLFKKHDNLTLVQSIHHNLILLLLYEHIKTKEVYKHLDKLILLEDNNKSQKTSLLINEKIVIQDDLNSLLEFEKIEMLLKHTKIKKKKIIEIGAGSGRTAKTILSIMNDSKYVIVDIPPAINLSIINLKKYFPEKRISTAFNANNQKELYETLNNNDIIFIFPHQIKMFEHKTFDITIAIDCLHEMDRNIIKLYMSIFEDISSFLYFKVWEHSGLNYSFYKNYSIHNKEDYAIQNHWKEHFKERCIYPSKYFQLGYEF